MSGSSRSVTAHYFRVTSPDGDTAFATKLRKVFLLTESDREHNIANADMNIRQRSVEGFDDFICGTVRLLRFVAPSKGKRGTNDTTPIDLLDDEGINEMTHFVYWPDGQVIAIEYNHHGPKVTHILKIVNDLYKQHYDEDAQRSGVDFLPANEARRILDGAIGVRKATFEIQNVRTKDRSAMPFGDAIKDIAQGTETQTVIITLAPEKHGKSWIMQPRQAIQKLLGYETAISKLTMDVVDEDEHVQTIDFVKDQVMRDFNVPVLTIGTKEINTDVFLSLMSQDMQSRIDEWSLR